MQLFRMFDMTNIFGPMSPVGKVSKTPPMLSLILSGVSHVFWPNTLLLHKDVFVFGWIEFSLCDQFPHKCNSTHLGNLVYMELPRKPRAPAPHKSSLLPAYIETRHLYKTLHIRKK
jgi:hypothetical protein